MSKQLSDLIAVFTLLATSYFGSATVISILFEVFAQVTGRRARFLRIHLSQVFTSELTQRILSNPLIRKRREEGAMLSTFNGKAAKPYNVRPWFLTRIRGVQRLAKGVDVPIAYIEPRDFALVLMRVAFQPDPKHPSRLAVKVRDATVKLLLETLVEGTCGNPPHIQERIEGWFRRDQEQLSASYGANSRLWGIAAGTLFALIVGLDTIEIVSSCGHSQMPLCTGELARLRQFLAMSRQYEIKTVIGYLISGLMISQGASFWFSVLSRFANLRGEGAKPR